MALFLVARRKVSGQPSLPIAFRIVSRLPKVHGVGVLLPAQAKRWMGVAWGLASSMAGPAIKAASSFVLLTPF